MGVCNHHGKAVYTSSKWGAYFECQAKGVFGEEGVARWDCHLGDVM